MIIEVPLWPPTTNSLYRNVNGRMLISKRARKFYKDGCELITPGTTLSCRLKLTVKLFPPDKRVRDIDNHLKAICDLLTKANVWEDDSLVDMLTVSRETIVPKGKFTVEIQELCQKPHE